MADFVQNTPFTAEFTDITANILDLNDGPHSFVFTDYRQTLTIENNEAVPLTVNLHGDGVTTHTCPGVGVEDVSAGKDFTVAIGATVIIEPKKISGYLGDSGNTVTVTVTGSTAAALGFAWLNSYP